MTIVPTRVFISVISTVIEGIDDDEGEYTETTGGDDMRAKSGEESIDDRVRLGLSLTVEATAAALR